MKKILIFSLLVLLTFSATAQIVDTTFYDSNWQGVKFKELAQYIRYDFDFKDPDYQNRTRIFYVGGGLEREGIPIAYNKFDGSMARWKGELKTYYPDGKKKEVFNFDQTGQLSGKKSTWDEAGNLIAEENYLNGVLHGQVIEFPQDKPDLCYVTVFDHGQPVNNESVIFFRSGQSVKVDYFTKNIIVQTPDTSDCKFTVKDGISSWYYDMNGIYVALNFAKAQQFGQYYQCFIVFNNYTGKPVEINPDNITGSFYVGDDSKPIELMSSDEYMGKIARTQAFTQALSAFASGMSTYNAGYSTSTTTGRVVGAGGWASGSATTTTYNPYERQAVLDREQERLNSQAEADKQKKDAIDGSILKRTVVENGETLVKSFYIKYLTAEILEIEIVIDGQKYMFPMPNANYKKKKGSAGKTAKHPQVKKEEKPEYPLFRPGIELGMGQLDSEGGFLHGMMGVFFEYIVNPRWSLNSGTYYSSFGASDFVPYSYAEGGYDIHRYYSGLVIPLKADYKLNTGRWFRVYGGGGILNRIVLDEDDELLNLGQGLNRYMPGVTAEIGVEIRSVKLGVSWFSDLTPYSTFNERMSGFLFTLGWRFGGSKAYIK